mmetsp:Transcript_9228/g.13083  ORF Transcript_9228/g.13083 Transcript_9228/m.13083 type:complete len:163 (+) Transcript_9228:35-523(+)
MAMYQDCDQGNAPRACNLKQPALEMAPKRSKSIQIIYPKFRTHCASSIEDPLISESSRQMYDSATWRMYHRIMTARRRAAVVPLTTTSHKNRKNISTRTEVRPNKSFSSEKSYSRRRDRQSFVPSSIYPDHLVSSPQEKWNESDTCMSFDDRYDEEIFSIEI